MEQRSEKELGKQLGRGATAKIYEWENNQVLKLFDHEIPTELIEREANKTRLLHTAGINVPAAGNLVEINGCLGLPLEKINGKTMQEHIIQKPWRMFHYWRMLAELQIKLYEIKPIQKLPPQRKFIKDTIQNTSKLEPAMKAVLLDSLDKLPDGNSIIHYDFYPSNILITANGPVIIDWMGAFKGNPLADIARTWVVFSNYLSPDLPEEYVPIAPYMRPLHRQTTKLILKHYLKHYFRLRPGGEKEFEAWKPIMAATALNESPRFGVEKVRLKIVQDAFPQVK
ncbi:MAG: phosphotransferase [Deltaproteobacteria bacterium]|nr:phosphotransferase [Deltaproteobacteria bacterium]